LEHACAPGEGADQHEQGRARQVEVGEQQVDGAKAVARQDVDAGLAGEGLNRAVGGGRSFEQAERRGADRDDAPAGRAGGVDGPGRCLRQLAGLQVHPVVARVLDLDRQEGAGADVEGERDAVDAARRERVQQAGREVETSGGGGDRAGPARENGLVVAEVGGFRPVGALDVGRQRHGADPLEARQQLAGRQCEVERNLAAGPLGGDRRRELGGEVDPIALLQLAGRAGESVPQRPADVPVQGHLDAGRIAPAGEAGRDHPGVVGDQEVAGREQRRQVGNPVVRQAVAHGQQARRVARTRRALGDQLARQVEIEILGPHGRGCYHLRVVSQSGHLRYTPPSLERFRFA